MADHVHNPADELASAMVREQLARRGVSDQAVLEAMRWVPRHLFVPGVAWEDAYSDRALPSSEGQTISQPYIVARMSEMLAVTPGCRVLDVGGGTGYQAAVLAAMGAEVVSIERHLPLVENARALLARLGLAGRVQMIHGDGTLGAQWAAPFDRIIVAAAAPQLPDALRQQLADPGRIVAPLGDQHLQHLVMLLLEQGRWREIVDIPCRFVPLICDDGDDDSFWENL